MTPFFLQVCSICTALGSCEKESNFLMYVWQNLNKRGTAFQLCILDHFVPAQSVHCFPLNGCLEVWAMQKHVCSGADSLSVVSVHSLYVD